MVQHSRDSEGGRPREVRVPLAPEQRRDRALAQKARYGPRRATDAAAIAAAWMSGPEMQRIRRNRQLAEVMHRLFSDAELGRIKALSRRGGTLTLAVADGPLLAEIKQFRHEQLMRALEAAGCAVKRIVLRLDTGLKRS